MPLEAYSEPEKIEARRRALRHAVTSITQNRSQTAVVPKNYVRKVKRHLLLHGTPYDKQAAAYCNDHIIGLWEDLWAANVGKKKPGDLTVAYLAGPEPLNDFRELIDLGVHPYNIFAFEAEKNVFNAALIKIKESEFPLLKIYSGSLDSYLRTVPRSFDIIYIDACGPLPSMGQNTLRLLADVFRYSRLAPLGVLVTNFALPDIAKSEVLDSYSDLLTAYLYPKRFLESGDQNWNLTESPAVDGMEPKSNEPTESFFHHVRGNFVEFYGQYVTRQLFDLGSFISPWMRMINSELWSAFFSISPKDAAEKARPLKHFSEDFSGGEFIVDMDMYPLGWTMEALFNGSSGCVDSNYFECCVGTAKLRDRWLEQLSGHPKPSNDARVALDAYEVLRQGIGDPWAERFKRLLSTYNYREHMFQFCDVPTEELAFFPVLSEYIFPMQYNAEATHRYSYVASGKITRMFLDVIPFDQCRYVWDWLPMPELMADSFGFQGQQLVYRFALDAIAKQQIRYNSEYLFGANVVGVNAAGFREKLVRPRVAL